MSGGTIALLILFIIFLIVSIIFIILFINKNNDYKDCDAEKKALEKSATTLYNVNGYLEKMTKGTDGSYSISGEDYGKVDTELKKNSCCYQCLSAKSEDDYVKCVEGTADKKDCTADDVKNWVTITS